MPPECFNAGWRNDAEAVTTPIWWVAAFASSRRNELHDHGALPRATRVFQATTEERQDFAYDDTRQTLLDTADVPACATDRVGVRIKMKLPMDRSFGTCRDMQLNTALLIRATISRRLGNGGLQDDMAACLLVLQLLHVGGRITGSEFDRGADTRALSAG